VKATPSHLAIRAFTDWAVRRSAAIASNICSAWSRSATESMPLAAGVIVLAKSSHC